MGGAISVKVIICYRKFVTPLLYLLTLWCLNHDESTVQADKLARVPCCVDLAAIRGVLYVYSSVS